MRTYIAVLALLLAGCATNPVTGDREFNLVSEEQELAIGLQTHRQVIDEFGVYNEKPELNEMVDRIGRRVAAVSDRPNLPWQFTLLDTPMVNAMALPGGYIYVTRGILERMNSEDELAGVIAHEVAHVAARHSARSMSQAQLAQIGMVLGSIIVGPAAAQAYGGLAELGAGLLFTRHSRRQETQADLLGTAYMTEAGYNPRGAENMLLALQRLQRGETSPLERYFIDHPDPGKRVGDVRKEIAALQARNTTIASKPLERDPFVRQLAEIITGRSTLQTTIRGNTVYQRQFGIIATAPQGWIATTEPGRLFVLAPRRGQGEGFIAQTLPSERLQGQNVQIAIRNQLQNMGLQYVTTGVAESATGERFTVDLWQGRTSNGAVAVESTQFVEGGSVIVFLEIGPANRRRTDLVSIVRSMRFDRDRARSADPPRMRVERSRRGDTWETLARRATGRPEHAEIVAKINGFDFPSTPPPDVLLKLPEDVIEEV